MNFAGKSGSHADFGLSAPSHIDSLSKVADTVTVPDAHLLFSGDFERSGADLIISDHFHRVVVPNYFTGDKRPALVSAQGAPLDPKFIDALTGHVQYAQAAGAAAAAKVIGHVVKMTGSASIVRNGVTIDVNSGDVVYQNDVVQTGSGSTLGLVMIDGTTFNMTANARLMMNDLTYDATSTSNTSLFTLVQGAATFVAGQVAKTGDMKVSTPVATLGIRGTAVILDISAIDGTVSVSVVNQRDGQVHALQVYNARGDLIGTVTSNGSSLTLTPTASFEVIAQESNKTVAQVLTEFNAFQQLLSTYEIGKQLVPNTPFPTDGRRGDNTQQPLTKFAGSTISPIDSTTTKFNADIASTKDARSGAGTDDAAALKPTGDGIGPLTKVAVTIGDGPVQFVNVAATSVPFVVTPSPVSRISSGPGDHFGPAMSADGQFVTYDPDGAIYLFDRQTGATKTIAAPGGGLTYGSPTISSDGHFVVYQGSDGTQSWIFIYNNDASDPAHYGQTTRLMSGGQPAISGDGSKLVIEQGGSIGLYDQQGHEFANFTAAALGITGTLWKPAISADGHVIAFWSSNSSSPGASGQLFTYDLSTATVRSIASTATDAGNSAASFSADGHYVVYQSDAPGGHSEIYLYDLRAGQVIFHTANPDSSYNPVLSPDGHFIIMASDARLTDEDRNAFTDIYVVDVTDPSHPVYKLVSVLDDGTQGDAASNLGAAISAGGQFVAFGSRASNFSSGDAPGTGDIFVVDPTSGHSAIILEGRNSPAVLSASGAIQLTGDHSGVTLGVSDSRLTASFDSHGNIQWSFSEPRSDFASLQPGQISVRNFVITLRTDRSTTEIPVKVSIYDVDQPAVPVADAAPVASPVTLAAGTEDTGYTITSAALLAGVTDIDGPSPSINAVGIVSGGGSIVDNHNGTFSYTPAPNYNGPVVFSYTASDGTLSASSTATLNIAAVNDAPTVSSAVTGGGAEGSGVATVNLLNFASDVDAGAVLHVANLVRTDPGGGIPAGFTLSPDGNSISVDTDSLVYNSLAQGETFTAHFGYDVVDEHGASVHQTAAVTVAGTNDAPVFTTGPAVTQLSVPANGVPFSHGETFAFGPEMSSDGRFIVYGASNQIPGQEDDTRLGDVYLYDRLTGTTKWISDPLSLANSGITPHAGETYDGLAAISRDGQYVTFRGQYQVPQTFGQPLIQSETFLYNTSTGVTTLVPGLNGDEPSINANGSLLAATGQSLTAPSSNTFTYNDVLVTDRLGHVVTRISGDANASPVNTADISPDGRYVTFWSTAAQIEVKNVKPGGGPVDSLTFNVGTTWPAGPSTPAGPVAQVYVFDRQTETINLVSVSPTGERGNGNSSVLTLQTSAGFIDIGDDWKSAFGADGRFIIFQSNASNLVAGDNNGAADVFLYDLQTHQVQLVSAAADGSSANGASYRPAISSDGHHIVFASDATNLLGASNTPAGANGFQTYIRDFDPATGLLSTGFSGFHNGDNQYGDSISRDGGIVAFGGAALAFNVDQGHAELISVAAGTVKFTGGSISDYNPAADTLTVTVSVAHGRLAPVVAIAPGSGLTIVGGFDGSHGILKFTGSIDAINHALQSGVTYTPTAGGPDAIAMTVTDGHGGTAAHTMQFDPGAPHITGVSMIGNTIAFDHDRPQAQFVAQGQVKFFGDPVSDSTPGFNQNSDALTVTVSVGHGTLTPAGPASGVTIVGGFDGHAGTLKFTGTIAAVNHALESGAIYAATSGGPDTITVTVTDGHGGTATQSAQFNPLAPAIDGELTDGQYEIFVVDRAGGTAGLVIEDSSLTAPNSGTLLTKGAFGFTDADLSDTHTATVIGSPVVDTSHAPGFVVPSGGLGTFTPLAVTESAGSGQVPWTFTVDNALVQSLGKGQYITQTYTVQLDDHHGGHPTQNVTVTIAGVNDAPVVTSASMTVSGRGTVVLGAANIGASDPDSTSFTFTASNVSHGTFQTTSNGTTWVPVTTFTTADLNAGHVRFVHDGSTIAPTFSIQADDGASANSLSAVVAGSVNFSVYPQFALTVNSDTFTGDPAGPTLITGNAATLTSGDSLMGAGHDVLALSGGGNFDLNAIAGYSGIEQVNAVNFSSGFALVTLRVGTTTDVATASGSGPATLNVSGAAVNTIQGNWSNVVLTNATVGDINSGSADNISLSGGTTVGSIEGNWADVGLNGTSRVTGAIQGNGDGNAITFNTLASWNPHIAIDGGGGFDTLNLLDFLTPAQNATLDLRSATLTNIERLNLNGSNNTLLVDTDALAGFTSIIGSVGSRIVTSEAALDLSGKTIFGGLTVQSSNATGTTFTVDSKPTAFQVYGGSGQDTLKTTSFAFTSTERDAVFATSSVETIVDTSGTYTAPANPNVYRLTPGTDTLTLTAADETINGNAVTLNAADSLNAGGGTDTLALYGSGSFDLNAIAGYSGIEQVNAANFSSGFALVTLRVGTTTDVATASGSGPATLNVSGAAVNTIQGNWSNIVLNNATVGDINSGSADNISLSGGTTVGSIEGNWADVGLNGTSRVTGAIQGNGDGNAITFNTLASWNPHIAIDGGGGFDTLNLLDFLTPAQNATLDLRSATLTNIERLNLNGSNNTLLVDTDALAGFTSIIGSVGSRIVTSEAALNLSGKTIFGGLTVQSSNATGTTFTVDSKPTAFQVYGGSGQDTLKTTSFAFTSTERDAVFATSSVETIIDQSGTYHSANYDAAPVITHAALTISQGHTVTLSTADIDFVDPDNSVVTYTVSNLSHGHFETGVGNDAVETTTFTSADVAAGLVSFVDDGSSATPTFSLTPNDGSIDGATVNGDVTFSAANYTMSSTQGVTISVTPEGATSGFVFPGAGNVTTPGIPEDRIAIGYDVVGGSHVVLDNAPLLGVHQMASLSSETHSSGGTTFVSTTLDAGHGVTLVQTMALASDANFFTTTIDITNNGAADISNLRFLRNFDPDQDVQAHHDYKTFNDVVQKPDGAETFAIVSAIGVESHTTVAMVGLGAEWQGSVFGFTNTDPFAPLAFNSPVDPDGAKADLSLSLTSSLGTLTHGGGHVQVTYITTNNVATSGSNALYGTTGDDTINGLGGDDLLIGLKGADTFVFNAASGGSGHDTVADFTSGQDLISLDYHAFDAAGQNDFSSWLATHATASGADTLIDLNVDGLHPGVDTILLKNVALASLQASDFHTV